jgi:phenylacetic acid degradation protein
MTKVYAFEGLVPVIQPGAFVHPDAVLIGDVVIGPRCFIGPCAVLRGDFGRIEIHEGANVQDNCVVHSFPGRSVIVEEDGHIGHAAVLHACTIKRNALVGMNATVMDNAVVGQSAFVAANSFVKAGFEVPDNTLVAGVPARIIKEMGEAEIKWKSAATAEYQGLAKRCLNTMKAVEALTEEEPDRPRAAAKEHVKPMSELKG